MDTIKKEELLKLELVIKWLLKKTKMLVLINELFKNSFWCIDCVIS